MTAEHTLAQLREHLRTNGYLFTDALYPTLLQLAEQSHPEWLKNKTPEYTKNEYLLNVDQKGTVIQPSSTIIKNIQNHPILQHWFYLSNNTLSIARWLVHLCGFRHRCIHLFLDAQEHIRATYVQIRSLKKYNEPGGFDMPVAGHVSGHASFREGLYAEASEELGLNLDTDVTHLRQIHTNNIAITPVKTLPNYFDVEHTAIYQATLTNQAYHRIRFIDGEVAALALFQIHELAALIQKFPQRVGGGLRDSFSFYQENKHV